MDGSDVPGRSTGLSYRVSTHAAVENNRLDDCVLSDIFQASLIS